MPGVLEPCPQTVTGELTGVFAQAQVQPAFVATHIVQAMRNDHAGRPRREIVVESFARPVAVHTTVAIQISQELLFLCVHTEHRQPGMQVLVNQRADVTELCVTIRRLTTGQYFGDIPQAAAQ